jgi:hypothetical protein
MPRPGCFTPGNDPVPIVQEAGWVPGSVWTGAENLALTGFDPRTVEPVASRRGSERNRQYTVVSKCRAFMLKRFVSVVRHNTDVVCSLRGTSSTYKYK